MREVGPCKEVLSRLYPNNTNFLTIDSELCEALQITLSRTEQPLCEKAVQCQPSQVVFVPCNLLPKLNLKVSLNHHQPHHQGFT